MADARLPRRCCIERLQRDGDFKESDRAVQAGWGEVWTWMDAEGGTVPSPYSRVRTGLEAR